MGNRKKCIKVSSFGSLFHFRKENAPKDASDNCFDCKYESECCYSAKKLYLNPLISSSNWPCSVVLSSELQNVIDIETSDIEELFLSKTEAEKKSLVEKCIENNKTNYGRCVYKMDNDVCDNQVVNMIFDDSSTATLTMIAFSKDVCARKTKIYGTKGELDWDDSKTENKIVHYDFLTNKTQNIDYENAAPKFSKGGLSGENIKLSGHGGSDYWLMDSFIEAILKKDKSLILTDVEDSFRSHLIVFAAEYSRVSQKIVDIKEFCQQNDITLA